MAIKALFFDVDGTLVDDKTKEIPPSAVSAIKKAKEKGHKVFINSGRVRCMLNGVDEKINADGILCGCGTQIVLDGKTVYKNTVSLEEANKIKRALKKYELMAILEEEKRAYFPGRPFKYPGMEKLYDIISRWCEIKLDAFNDESYSFDKFCVLCDRNNRENLDEFVKLASGFEFIDRGDYFFEFVPKNNSKGSALLKVLEYYNIPKEEAYVFGDSMNDLTMFNCGVKNRILLAEHDEVLREYATFIIKKVLEDGIEYAMKELEII